MCVFVASVTVVGQYYEGRTRLIVVSMIQVGPGVGGIILPYLLRELT